LPFEIDPEIEREVLTGHAGVPMLIELFRATGGAVGRDDGVQAAQAGAHSLVYGGQPVRVLRA
jgi:hypothetical protein